MNQLLAHVALAFGLLFSQVSTTARADTTTLMELDRTEPFDAMTFHGGYLFVGQSRKDLNSFYMVHVFDQNQKLIKSIPMSHAIEHLYAYGPDSVLAIGTSASPHARHNTVISFAGGSFQARDQVVPMTAWANDWLGTFEGKDYFSDMGGNPSDEERQNNPRIPAQTIVSIDRYGRAEYLPFRVRGSLNGIIVGEQILVNHLYDMRVAYRNIQRVNMKTGVSDELFDSPRNRLWDLVTLGPDMIAVSESMGDRVIFVNHVSKIIKNEVLVEGEPRSIAKVGTCILVGARAKRAVQIISVKDPGNPSVTGSLDFSTTGGAFHFLEKITVDPQNGRVYGRSSYPCQIEGACDAKSWNSVAVSSLEDAALVKAQCF